MSAQTQIDPHGDMTEAEVRQRARELVRETFRMYDRIQKLENACRDVLGYRVGELPVSGWLNDTEASRAALGRMAMVMFHAETVGRG